MKKLSQNEMERLEGGLTHVLFIDLSKLTGNPLDIHLAVIGRDPLKITVPNDPVLVGMEKSWDIVGFIVP